MKIVSVMAVKQRRGRIDPDVCIADIATGKDPLAKVQKWMAKNWAKEPRQKNVMLNGVEVTVTFANGLHFVFWYDLQPNGLDGIQGETLAKRLKSEMWRSAKTAKRLLVEGRRLRSRA